MTESPATCSPDTSLREAATMMVDHYCGAIPVVGDGQEPQGIVPDRDGVVRLVAQGQNPSTRQPATP